MTDHKAEVLALADRIKAYLDDAPLDGRHSDKAGGNAYELLEEAADELRASAAPAPAGVREALEDVAAEIRQSLIDAAFVTKDLRVSASSAMFNAEKIVTAVITKFQNSNSSSAPPDWKQDQAETTRIKLRSDSVEDR